MSKSKIAFLSIALAAGLVLGGVSAFADTPGAHPAYLHALSDLRHARAYLDKLTPDEKVDAKELKAIEEIDKAIAEIKKAAIDDGKNLTDHPPVDAKVTKEQGHRFKKAVELLKKAEEDINKGESDVGAIHLQKEALRHVKEAIHTVEEHIKVLK